VHPTCLRSLPAFARASLDQLALELCKPAQHS
jgi:hypothetical protein